MHDCASVWQLHSLSHAVRAATPAGIHEPHIRFVLAKYFTEHVGVFRRMPDEKNGPEARAESRPRLGYAALGSRNLCGVAGEEIIHRLFRAQLCNWRKNSEGIGGEKHNIFWMSRAAARHIVRDVAEGIRRTRVLRDRLIFEFHTLGRGIQYHILEDGTEH